jgi:hypothetical protein
VKEEGRKSFGNEGRRNLPNWVFKAPARFLFLKTTTMMVEKIVAPTPQQTQ